VILDFGEYNEKRKTAGKKRETDEDEPDDE
jgi:hypothetical protein